MTRTLEELTHHAVSLIRASSDTPLLDVQLLIDHVFGFDRVKQLTYPELRIEDAQKIEIFDALIGRRALHEPLAYLLGSKEFWKSTFFVNASVLIPRPETEILVEAALKALQENCKVRQKIRVLDLGTGSGCIGLSIAQDLDSLSSFASIEVVLRDKSEEALKVAKKNAAQFQFSQAVSLEFSQGDWFEEIIGVFDCIVSNPPYIPEHDPRVYEGGIYEPAMALYAPNNGTADIDHILACSENYLAAHGTLLIEIGQGQAPLYSNRVNAVIKDNAGIDRVLLVTKTR